MKLVLLVIGLFASSAISCPDKDPFCSFCNGPVCIYCVASYPGPQGRCIPPNRKIDNCIAYAADGVCRSCKLDFTLKNNACVKITNPSCYEMNQDSCTFCHNRILQMRGRCSGSTTCSDPNCVICKNESGVEVCGLCKPGWALQVINGNKYRCVQEYGSAVNCLRVFNENPSLCAVCDLNYYWKNAACVRTNAYSEIQYLPRTSRSWYA